MHIAILIAGIADPKRPLEKPATGLWTDILQAPTTPFKLSPFDEAALETALKLRDREPGTRLTALVTDASTDTALLRTVASYRLDRVAGLRVPAAQRGNPAWLARHVPAQLAGDPAVPVDLILAGREHGDLDDGMAVAYLAQSWDMPFVSQALHVREQAGGTLQAERASGASSELIELSVPALISISNDKDNRLRHPLMKNVMLARQQKFEIADPPPDTAGAPAISCELPAAHEKTRTPCQFLHGSVDEQAIALASYLKTWKNPADTHAHT
ncbi:hypothetical protein KVP10_07800 [Candidimonas humi]|jgi:electron transfer flavoprotein beta subunit|uniref:Electron transfer flavoprotein alpha/beta-subunit N-terminal domain-containing protein n=1 Tax=Candidimonas humi TaxID=683355 RepID=A0ABV8NY12_9BURK|nr:hypothetical protein [Candidimonas humi]MBV6304786.1 hypothetical protein [Candidimonas humi]